MLIQLLLLSGRHCMGGWVSSGSFYVFNGISKECLPFARMRKGCTNVGVESRSRRMDGWMDKTGVNPEIEYNNGMDCWLIRARRILRSNLDMGSIGHG